MAQCNDVRVVCYNFGCYFIYKEREDIKKNEFISRSVPNYLPQNPVIIPKIKVFDSIKSTERTFPKVHESNLKIMNG